MSERDGYIVPPYEILTDTESAHFARPPWRGAGQGLDREHTPRKCVLSGRACAVSVTSRRCGRNECELVAKRKESQSREWQLTEVPLTVLHREPRAVVERVERGELAVVSRHGRPVAMIVQIEDALAWVPPGLVDSGEGRRLGAEFERRLDRRQMSALLHGRWQAHERSER